MYEVIKDCSVICTINNICYVKYRPLIDSWCVCEKDESQAICVTPVVEDCKESLGNFYARLGFHEITDDNKDFDLFELKEITNG